MPRTLGGQTMPVGWNCTNSISMSDAPASIRERVPVAGIFPTVAGDPEARPMPPVARTTAFALEQLEAATFALVAEGARDAIAVFQQREHRALHVNVDP